MIRNHFPSSSNTITINFFIRVARKKIKNETIIILIEIIEAPFLTLYLIYQSCFSQWFCFVICCYIDIAANPNHQGNDQGTFRHRCMTAECQL